MFKNLHTYFLKKSRSVKVKCIIYKFIIMYYCWYVVFFQKVTTPELYYFSLAAVVITVVSLGGCTAFFYSYNCSDRKWCNKNCSTWKRSGSVTLGAELQIGRATCRFVLKQNFPKLWLCIRNLYFYPTISVEDCCTGWVFYCIIVDICRGCTLEYKYNRQIEENSLQLNKMYLIDEENNSILMRKGERDWNGWQS